MTNSTAENSDMPFFAHKLCAFFTAMLTASQLKVNERLLEKIAFQLSILSKVLRVEPEDVKLNDGRVEVTISGVQYSFTAEELAPLAREILVDTAQLCVAN